MKNIINTTELIKAIEDYGEFEDFTEQSIAKEFVESLCDFDGSINQDELDEYGRQWADLSTPIYTTDILDFYRENINFISYIDDAQKKLGAEGFNSLIVGIYMLRKEIADRVIDLILK